MQRRLSVAKSMALAIALVIQLTNVREMDKMRDIKKPPNNFMLRYQYKPALVTFLSPVVVF
jgi:hypothetical protein